ncbi:unnamed protein product [Cunninghamella blakesleeana]
MIQTTLFNYFTSGDVNERPKHKLLPPASFKQTNLTHYFKTVPKKKNLILNCFKLKEKENTREDSDKSFDLVFVDIQSTWEYKSINCIKRDMYNPNLKYIAISYRWGEWVEQLVKTPDYTAHITSFNVGHLIGICYCIQHDPDLKDIPYIWIDAISVNQQNHSRKKETILKMSDIYKNASYILAVPDLHYGYLANNPANSEVIDLIFKYRDRIHQDIKQSSTDFTQNIENSRLNSTQYTNHRHRHHSITRKLKYKLMKETYLVNDWSNRAWVISEYEIAKEKYTKYGTPLKYTFLSLLCVAEKIIPKLFFSYTFANQENSKVVEMNDNYNTGMKCNEVDNSNKFIYYLKSRFVQQSHIEMMVKSNASRNEDRFYAILPSWNKYQHLIKKKNKVSNWNITDMLSVKLKLYEILDDNDDLWNKARLLLYCSIYFGKPILPSFATQHQVYFTLEEIDNFDYCYKMTIKILSSLNIKMNEKENNPKDGIGSIFKQNLKSIEFNKQSCSLSIKADKYFIFNTSSLVSSILNQEELSSYSLNNNDYLKLIYIPFFTYDLSEEKFHPFPLNNYQLPILSGKLLLGDMNTNRWILFPLYQSDKYGEPSLCSANNYIFNIY